MTKLTTNLEAIMANPFVLAVAFVLTLIGAWSGIRSVLGYLLEKGQWASGFAIEKILKKPILDSAEYAVKSGDDVQKIVGHYAVLLTNQIFHFSMFCLYMFVLLALYPHVGGSYINIFLAINCLIQALSHIFKSMTYGIRVRISVTAVSLVRKVSDSVEKHSDS